MSTVELIYDRECPNVTAVRRQLLTVFTALGLTPRWIEWDRADPASPGHVRQFGSPTVLVNGHDVAGEAGNESIHCCRLYRQEDGRYQGVPSSSMIRSALMNSVLANKKTAKTWRKTGLGTGLSILPGIGLAALPKLFCPACWPAYAGILSSLGLGFINYTPYLFPLTLIFLVIAVSVLAYRAPARRGYGPCLLGLVSAAMILVGKFLYASDTAMFFGIALLIAASFWNAWPRRAKSERCPACAPLSSTDINQEKAE